MKHDGLQLGLTQIHDCSVPSGFNNSNCAWGFVTFVTSTLTRCPAVPLNVSRASCPATVVVTVTGGPPGVIIPVTSGALLSDTVKLPVLPLEGVINRV